jgi:putative PIG3 family NAD(P)H quinone oxidoreductase
MSDIPKTMKAVLADPPGGPEALLVRDVPVPVPADDEVLIKVHAAGLNRADLLQRQGKYDPPAGMTRILGMEAAGEVVALGKKVQRWKVGDKVCALMAGGAYAEYASVCAEHCLPWPKGFDAAQAGLTMEAVFTVWANVFEAGQLKPGETALIHGGASGIGTFAIQMVKAFGAEAIVTVGSSEKAEACLKLGAKGVINYHEEGFAEHTLALTQGKGVDVVLDMIGGEYVMQNLKTLAPFGRHVSIATQHGRKAEVDIGLIMQRRLVVTGSTLRGRDKCEKTRLAREIEAQIWPLLEKGAVKPVIFQTFPLNNVAEAHKVMETGRHIGKIGLDLKA